MGGELVSRQLLQTLWQPYELNNGDKSFFASGWDMESCLGWRAVGHDGGGVLRATLWYQEDIADSYIIIYLTNGNRDGVWSRTLTKSLQREIAPSMLAYFHTFL